MMLSLPAFSRSPARKGASRGTLRGFGKELVKGGAGGSPLNQGDRRLPGRAAGGIPEARSMKEALR
jgi:hypothetical protein